MKFLPFFILFIPLRSEFLVKRDLVLDMIIYLQDSQLTFTSSLDMEMALLDISIALDFAVASPPRQRLLVQRAIVSYLDTISCLWNLTPYAKEIAIILNQLVHQFSNFTYDTFKHFETIILLEHTMIKHLASLSSTCFSLETGFNFVSVADTVISFLDSNRAYSPSISKIFYSLFDALFSCIKRVQTCSTNIAFIGKSISISSNSSAGISNCDLITSLQFNTWPLVPSLPENRAFLSKANRISTYGESKNASIPVTIQLDSFLLQFYRNYTNIQLFKLNGTVLSRAKLPDEGKKLSDLEGKNFTEISTFTDGTFVAAVSSTTALPLAINLLNPVPSVYYNHAKMWLCTTCCPTCPLRLPHREETLSDYLPRMSMGRRGCQLFSGKIEMT